MSVTFVADIDVSPIKKEEPCLCAQMSDVWVEAFRDGVQPHHREDLATAASPRCFQCEGTGVEVVDVDERPSLNLSNANAWILLRVLGFDLALTGRITVPEARRGLLRVRNRSNLSAFVRQPETVYGPPRPKGDGTVELRPVIGHSKGLSEEDILYRIEMFENFVEDTISCGACTISWA